MKKYLLPRNGKFYKANMHTHTTVSDGRLTPEEAKEVFKSLGYSIVAFTDHETIVPHPELRDDDFLPITSYELSVSSGWNTFTKCYHLNVYMPEEDRDFSDTFCLKRVKEQWLDRVTERMREHGVENRPYSKECAQRIIDAANAEGCLVSYNHPVWSLNNYEFYSKLKGFDGIELVNGATYRSSDQEYVPMVFDDMLRNGEKVVPVGGDDGHHPRHYGLAWTMVKADELSYDSILDGIEKGNCYMSTGPEIKEIYVEGDKVTIKTSPAEGIIYTAMGRSHQNNIMEQGGEPVTEATFTIKPWHVYFRITVRDMQGKRANTRAYWLDELDLEA